MADEQVKKVSKQELENRVAELQAEVKRLQSLTPESQAQAETELRERVQALEKELASRPSQEELNQLYADIERGVNERIALAQALEESKKEMSLMRMQANRLVNVVESNVRPKLDVRSELTVRDSKHVVAYVSPMKEAVDLWRKRYALDDDLVLVLKGV